MYPAKEITDQVFGRLTALYPSKLPGKKKWLCQCECGGFIRVPTAALISARTKGTGTKSCGCLKSIIPAERNRTHGMSKSLTHVSWCAMKTRCYNPRIAGYKDYGGRGIIVCERWKYSFENFLADMGERTSKELSIERINNDGNYEPGNCRWATRLHQNRNSRNCHYVNTPLGKLTLTQVVETYGVKLCTLKRRVRRGFSDTDLIKKSLRSCSR